MIWILPGNDEQHTADPEAGQQHIHPDVRREWVQEREDAWIGAIGFVVEDRDSQSHEGLGKIDDFLSHVSDGERCHSQICHLKPVRINSWELA